MISLCPITNRRFGVFLIALRKILLDFLKDLCYNIFKKQRKETVILTGAELKRKLKKAGCYKLREDTNHEKWFSPITNEKFSVPRHNSQDVNPSTLQSILNAAGLK